MFKFIFEIMTDKLTKYFGDAEFWRSTLRLALPIAFQNLLMSSFSLVDTLMVGQLGDIALSSVGMAGQWSWLMGLVLFGMSSGSAVFISQYWGVGDRKRINEIYGIMMINTLLVTVVFTLVGLLAPGAVVSLFNDNAEVVQTGASYLRVASISYIAQAFSYTFSTLLRSTENVKLPMYAGLFSATLNIFFNYALIFGKFGLPELGIEGAALATVISSWFSPIFVFIVSMRTRTIVRAPIRELFSFSRRTFFGFYRVSWPVIFNESLWGLGTVCYNIVFGRLGYEHYAAVTIYRTIEGIFFVFFLGLCTASSVLIGKAIGAGHIKEAERDGKRFTVLMVVIAALLGGVIILLRGGLVSLFNLTGNITQTTVDSAMGILAVYAAELPLRQIPYILIVGLFRPGGDTVTGMKYDLMFVWLFALPLTIIAAFVIKLPFVAVFAVMLCAEDIPKSALCIRRFVSRKWIMPITEEGKRAMKM